MLFKCRLISCNEMSHGIVLLLNNFFWFALNYCGDNNYVVAWHCSGWTISIWVLLCFWEVHLLTPPFFFGHSIYRPATISLMDTTAGYRQNTASRWDTFTSIQIVLHRPQLYRLFFHFTFTLVQQFRQFFWNDKKKQEIFSEHCRYFTRPMVALLIK